MQIKIALLAPLAALVMSLPAHAEKIGLEALSGYLNGLTTMQAPFTQVNADGTISTGTLSIQRPGRVRRGMGRTTQRCRCLLVASAAML